MGVDRLRVGWLNGFLGGVPRAQKMLKGHLPRVIYHQIYTAYKDKEPCDGWAAAWLPGQGDHAGLQGYLAHKKLPTPQGLPQGPRHSPTVGS